MSVKISSLNTASTISSGDDINIAGNNPLTFSDWGGGWFMQDSTWIRSYNSKSLWMDNGKIGADGCLTIGYGGYATSAGGAIIAGNVGIGTDTPSTTLDVRGSANFRGSTYYGVTLERTATGGNIYLYEGNSPKIYLQSADNIIFNNGYNFGIGTGSPSYKLQIRPSAVFGNSEDGNISIWSSLGGGTVTNPSSVGGIIFGDENTLNSYQGRIAVVANNPSATTASHMRFYTNAGGGNSATTERMRITSAGNVGIGTTSPASKLQVTTATNENVAIGSLSSIPTGRTLILQSTSLGGSIETYSSLTAGYVPLLLNTNGANVGIGTTTPAFTLDVNGTARVGGVLTANATLSNTAGVFALTMQGNYTGLRTGVDGSFNVDVYKSGTGYINPFRIASNGAATFSSSVTAGSFIKSGGTSAQFLKADGSIDSNTYVSSSALAAYLPLAGGNLTGLVISTANIEATAFRTDGNFELTSATTGLKSNYYDTRFYANSVGSWVHSTAAAATGGSLEFRQGFAGTTKGYVYWDAAGFGLLNNTGNWAVRTNIGGSMGGTLYGAWISTGTFTASALVKSGGTSSQFLKADGSIDTNAYITSAALSGYLPLTGGNISGALSVGGGFTSSLINLSDVTTLQDDAELQAVGSLNNGNYGIVARTLYQQSSNVSEPYNYDAISNVIDPTYAVNPSPYDTYPVFEINSFKPGRAYRIKVQSSVSTTTPIYEPDPSLLDLNCIIYLVANDSIYPVLTSNHHWTNDTYKFPYQEDGKGYLSMEAIIHCVGVIEEEPPFVDVFSGQGQFSYSTSSTGDAYQSNRIVPMYVSTDVAPYTGKVAYIPRNDYDQYGFSVILSGALLHFEIFSVTIEEL